MKWQKKAGLILVSILGVVLGLGWLWGRRGAASGGGEVKATEPRAESLTQQMNDAMQRADTSADLRAEAEKATAEVDAKIQAVEVKPPPPTAQGVADAFNKRARERKSDG